MQFLVWLIDRLYKEQKGMVYMRNNQQSILDYFGVNSQKELLEFMQANPKDKDVLLLKELLIRAENGGDSDE